MLKPKQVLIYLAIKFAGDWDLIYQAIIRKEMFNAKEVEEAVNSLKCKVATIFDKEYPQILRTIYKPPFVLFYYGDISLINDFKKCLGVVGSREPTSYGLKITEKLVSEVSPELIIVSGLALGIDAAAHRAAINSYGKTVAVLGGGIDYVYPKENLDLFQEIKENHLLLSEIPGKEFRKSDSFAFRNRIITGLSKCLLVTDCKPRSGTNVSVNFALSQDRDVLVVPYRADENSECNRIIKQGAALVESGEDIMFFIK